MESPTSMMLVRQDDVEDAPDATTLRQDILHPDDEFPDEPGANARIPARTSAARAPPMAGLNHKPAFSADQIRQIAVRTFRGINRTGIAALNPLCTIS